MQSSSPPRKKLKQARLPFQILSPKKKDQELSPSCLSRKRHFSDTPEDVTSVKIFKPSDDPSKENESLRNLPEEIVLEEIHVNNKIVEEPNENSRALDPAVEAVDSDDSMPSDDVRASGAKISSVKHVPCISNSSSLLLEKSVKSSPAEKSLVPKSVEEEHDVLIVETDKNQAVVKEQEIQIEVKPVVGLLSHKTYNMFAKWRKVHDGVGINQSSPKVSPEKAVEAVEEIIICEESSPSSQPNDVTSTSNSGLAEHAETHSGTKISEIASVEVCVNKSISTATENDARSMNSIDLTNEAKECSSPQLNDSSCVGPMTPKASLKTPTRRLTPKQREKENEKRRKFEEKEKQKVERQMERQRLKNEKEEQRKREREEKEELRRKEKDKRQAEIEQKIEEKKRKDELKAEEKRKREEKKKAEEEEEEKKKAKASAMFSRFFLAKPLKTDLEEVHQAVPISQNFMPFEVKADMQVAPNTRVVFSCHQKQNLDEVLKSEYCQLTKEDLYVESLKAGKIIPRSSLRTWPLEEPKEDDDVCVLEQDEGGVFVAQKKLKHVQAKLLQFHENQRPAYWGTWRRKSSAVTGRHPFGLEKTLDYEVDSDDEWEEEEPGESLHGSDDEKEQVSDDEYEVDNSVFVPHGYLSDDEGDADESNIEVLSPETQKAKLKLLGEEFVAQMKNGTSTLKPLIIFLTTAMQANASKLGSSRYQKLQERKAVWQEENGPIVLSKGEGNENCDASVLGTAEMFPTGSSGPRAKRKVICEEAIPALITLVHGNQNNKIFLVKEFSSFLQQCAAVKSESKSELEGGGNFQKTQDTPIEPRTPSKSNNALVEKYSPLPEASKISISAKIKEIAVWKLCPEEGQMHNRYCWYVPKEMRMKYNLLDLKLPNNSWVYTLNPKATSQSRSPNNSLMNVVGDSKAALITKFTKVMTPEEKQKQWDSMKATGQSTPSSACLKNSSGKITAYTSNIKIQDGSKKTFCDGLPPHEVFNTKKRVPLLVSVPRGHEITSNAHCSLLSKFQESSTSPSHPKETEKLKQHEVACITLD